MIFKISSFVKVLIRPTGNIRKFYRKEKRERKVKNKRQKEKSKSIFMIFLLFGEN